jgi:hypothetical protein
MKTARSDSAGGLIAPDNASTRYTVTGSAAPTLCRAISRRPGDLSFRSRTKGLVRFRQGNLFAERFMERAPGLVHVYFHAKGDAAGNVGLASGDQALQAFAPVSDIEISLPPIRHR